MRINLEPGKYVVAVSGGVDSMVLLHLLIRRHPDLKLAVAHFDHGIRPDSVQDRKLVQAAAKELGLPFVYHEGKLGSDASEAAARQARYDFLHHVRQAGGAKAVITAHHQDDLIETMVLNLLRGTGRKGLCSLKSTDIVKRPLLDKTKRQIRAYALVNKIDWREDSTNTDETYRRNYIRHQLLPKLTVAQRRQLVELARSAHQNNQHLDAALINYLHSQPSSDKLSRISFVRLPHDIAKEVLASWLRAHGIRQFDRKALDRLVVAGKTARTGSRTNVMQNHWLEVQNKHLALTSNER